MKNTSKFLILVLIGLLAISAIAKVKQITVPQGTEVILAFDQRLSSKTAKIGESVALHVEKNVKVAGKTVLKGGTKVTATISQVDKRKRYGINAKMRMTFNPVRSTYGGMITLQPRSKGKYVEGNQSAAAAGATVGGAMVLGPVGLVGGYFVLGKPVTIKVGDLLLTEVAKTVKLVHK
jgi:hypothetical protein